MRIVTIASHTPAEDYFMFPEMLASVRKYGHEPLILGQDGSGTYGGLGTKLKLVKTALEQGRVEDEYMIVCDSFDVLFQQDPALAVSLHMLACRDSLLFTCEKNLFPDNGQDYPESPTPWRYLNSGFIVGKTALFLEVLSQISEHDMRADFNHDNPNDQHTWGEMYRSGKYPIKLDHHTHVCLCMHGVTAEELDFSGEKVRNTVTGQAPVALHLNGSHEVWKDRVLHKLGL